MTLERVDVEGCEDRLQIVLHRARYDFVLARLKPGQRVLEIGVGAGSFTKELFPRCGSYVGVEFDHVACAAARQKTEGRAEIIQGDARNLPFRESEFAFIICLEVLEHLGNFRAGVENIHRCLQSDGTVIISVPYRRIGGKSKTNEYHPYEPGEQELVSLLQKLFVKVEVHYQFFEEKWWMTIARKLHLRRVLGLHRIYADLSAGLPHATSKLKIGEHREGLKTNLIVVASGKKSLVNPV